MEPSILRRATARASGSELVPAAIRILRSTPALALAGMLAAGRAGAAPDLDLKDAPAQTAPKAGEPSAPRPIPAARPILRRRLDAPKRREPLPDKVMMVELRLRAFRGKTPEATRAAAEAFLHSQGWKILAYQDSEALSAVEFRLDEASGGLIATLRRALRAGRLGRQIASLPLVSSVRQNGHDSWTALLTVPSYEDSLARLWSKAGELRLVPHVRRGRGGIWVVLSLDGRPFPEYSARALVRFFPDKVAWAEPGFGAKTDWHADSRTGG